MFLALYIFVEQGSVLHRNIVCVCVCVCGVCVCVLCMCQGVFLWMRVTIETDAGGRYTCSGFAPSSGQKKWGNDRKVREVSTSRQREEPKPHPSPWLALSSSIFRPFLSDQKPTTTSSPQLLRSPFQNGCALPLISLPPSHSLTGASLWAEGNSGSGLCYIVQRLKRRRGREGGRRGERESKRERERHREWICIWNGCHVCLLIIVEPREELDSEGQDGGISEGWVWAGWLVL